MPTSFGSRRTPATRRRSRRSSTGPRRSKQIQCWSSETIRRGGPPPLALHAEVTVPLAHPEQKSSTIVGTLSEVQVNLAGVVKLNFHKLVFTAVAGKKLDVNATLYTKDEQFPRAPVAGGGGYDGPVGIIQEHPTRRPRTRCLR